LSVPPYLLAGTQLQGNEPGETVYYRAEVAEDSAFTRIVTTGDLFSWADTKYGAAVNGAVYLSPRQVRVLEPGRTYYWRLAATDGSNWVRSTDNGATGTSAYRSFFWDPDPAVAPTDTQGPFTTNLVTGAVSTSVSTPSFVTLGGPVGANLSYNSHDFGDYGLKAGVYDDANTNGVLDATDAAVSSGRDRQVSVEWPGPGPTGDAADRYVAVWDGVITVPSITGTSYQIGLECSGYGSVAVNGVTVIDRTLASAAPCRSSYGATPNAIDWATAALPTDPASIHVETSDIGGPDTSEARLWFRIVGQSIWSPIPTSWFTPVGARALPSGWRLSVGPAAASYVRAAVASDLLVLVGADGSRTSWHRKEFSSTSVWHPEEGEDGTAELAANGSVVVHAADGSDYLFDTAGNLSTVSESSDDEQRSTAVVVSYDSSVRPVSAIDPVTGRALELDYQITGGNPDCPATPSWLPAGETMAPAGMLCAVRFKATAGATGELWTTLTYVTIGTGTNQFARVARVINFPDLSASGNANLDANETTQFGYDASLDKLGSPLTTVRTPLAYDAVRAGVRADNPDTRWALGLAQPRPLWLYPSAVTAPAPLPGAARPQTAYTLTFHDTGNAATRTRATEVSVATAGLDQSAPNGYVTRYAGIDETGRAATVYDIGGRSTTLTWDPDTDRVTDTVQSPANLRTKTVTEPLHDWPTAEWGPAPSSDTCWAILDPNNVACSDVSSTVTEYDQDWSATGGGAAVHGLQVEWWANTLRAPSGTEKVPALNTLGVPGTATSGAVDVVWGTSGPSGLKTASGAIVTDGFSANLSGDIVFPSTGTYTLKVEVSGTDEKAAVWIDNTPVVMAGAGGTRTGTYANTAAGSRHAIRIAYSEGTGTAILRLKWTPPGGTEAIVPAANLYPAYGYPTRVTVNGTGADSVQTIEITDWTTGAANESTGNGTSSDLETAYTYETAAQGWGRRLTRTLPAGNAWEYAYWGATETTTSAVCGVPAGTAQGANLRRRVGPDPDDYTATGGTNGSGLRRVEEFVYDVYGHQLASRVGFESSAGSKVLAVSVPWTCTVLDGRWRSVRTDFPASGSYAARTVWVDTAKDANPLVNEACDDSVPGSPAASSDVCAGKGGVITTTVDLLGRTVASTDVWAKTTTTSYNQAGQVTSSSGIFGDVRTSYTAEGQVDVVQYRATAGSGTYVTLADAGYSAAGAAGIDTRWVGLLDTVAYANGTSMLSLNGTGTVRRDSNGAVSQLRFDGPGGAVASNTVTRDPLSGRITGESYDGSGNSFGYAYDSNGRLVQAVLPGGRTLGFWFGDGTVPSGCAAPGLYRPGLNSNRVCSTDTGSGAAVFSYDRADRLVGSTLSGYTGTFGYDTRGNVTAIGVETYGYDGADRHLSTSNGTTTSTFVRDLTGAVVEYRLNGVIQNRYSGSVTLDASGTSVVERTIGLPGGVVLTTRASGDVWSYPNIAGSVTATANSTGTRIDGPLLYDPFGNPISGYPDNAAGLLDSAWYGTADRQTQHQPGLHPAVDMGARQYQPQLGRFTETDPVEGGGTGRPGRTTSRPTRAQSRHRSGRGDR